MPILIQTDIEGEIVRLADLLEEATEQLAVASEAWAHAEADYKVKFARYYMGETGPEHTRKQSATIECAEELRQALVQDARKGALTEKCRQLRAQLDAVRTLSANVRVQT